MVGTGRLSREVKKMVGRGLRDLLIHGREVTRRKERKRAYR